MYREFEDFEELLSHVESDRNSLKGVDRRYPVRFVLFDRFEDSSRFIHELQGKFKVHVERVDDWLEEEDGIMYHKELALKIKNYIKNSIAEDITHTILTPFSELARFYNNLDGHVEFYSLISSIRNTETSDYSLNQRIYIPIIGLGGRMADFIDDSQIYMWYFKAAVQEPKYEVVLCDQTYGTILPEEKYTLVPNVKSWLNIWHDRHTRTRIISTSKTIYTHARYATPENAFTFYTCRNAYEFLTDGLGLNFGRITYDEADETHWEKLAKGLNVRNFSLDAFVDTHFEIRLGDYKSFLTAWFKCKDPFSRWLLRNYYLNVLGAKGYVAEILKKRKKLNNSDFFEDLLLKIFNEKESENYLEERTVCLEKAAQKRIIVAESIANTLKEKLEALAAEKGYLTALRYLSPLTEEEKKLALQWYVEGNVSLEAIGHLYPELCSYLTPSTVPTDLKEGWVHSYIDAYKQAKIRNKYTPEVKDFIDRLNGSTTSFNEWYQNFKTIIPTLGNRKDIDKYHWVDGLGIDWIPLICRILKEKKDEGIYLNEILIARSKLPSVTETNKEEILNLGEKVSKKREDLDKFAHTSCKYPEVIVEELKIVEDIVQDILSTYTPGQKIAIVSDHGLTALSQFCEGYNWGGVTSHHHGRVAMRNKAVSTCNDASYTLEDQKTECALRHESLCGKVPEGLRAHGGCTPEEILVPVFIISSSKNPTRWNATLLRKELAGWDPVVRYTIKGLSALEIPSILYNDKRYAITREEGDTFVSERLDLVEGVTEISLCIGENSQTDEIQFNLGVQEEEDLFS